jgi:hypothetical protein
LHSLLGRRIYLRGHVKEHVCVVPTRAIEAVMTVDANMLRRAGDNAVRRTAVWVQLDGGRL